MQAAIPMTDTITIPGYSIVSKLGQGGMASVYLAVQHSFEREVALKVMSPLLNSDPSFAARFKREARIVAQLSHASIVPVFEVGEHQSCHYLSMEYLSGGDLKRRVLDGERELGLALNVCTALSAALDVAHRKGFIHRDIKPENILFREDGTPVLTDFGIARAVDSGRSMTLAGMLVGTPDYMSPEQVKGLELDGRGDLYSLGVVFYEVLTGTVPFKADSTLSVALKQVGEPLPALPPEYAAYQEFLDCLTAKDRDQRFASGAEVARALRVIGTDRGARGRVLPRSPTASEGTAVPSPVPSPVPTPPPPPISPTYASQPTLARPRTPTPPPEPGRPPSQPEVATSPPASNLPPAEVPQGEAPPKPHWVKSFALRSQPVWMSAAAVGALAVGVALIVGGFKGSHEPSVAAAATAQAAAPATVNAQASAATGQTSPSATALTSPAATAQPVQPALPMQSAAPTQAAQTASAQNPPPATAAGSPPAAALASNTPAAAPATVQTPTSGTGSALPADSTTPAAAVADTSAATARRKRLAEERRQRKEDEAQMLAQQAAQVRAEQMQAQEAHVQELLVAAKSELASGAFWKPAGDNAADHYREVLKLEPTQSEALAGAQRVANILVAEAAQAESVGDVYNTRLLLDQVQSLQPDHPKLADLQSRLEQLQSAPTSPDARDRERLDRAAKYMARVEQDLGRSPLDYKAVDSATDDYDRAVSAAAMAPGLPSLRERLIGAYATAVRTEIDTHDPKRAQKLINTAHKRKWASDELDQLEAGLKASTAPAPEPIKEAGASGAER